MGRVVLGFLDESHAKSNTRTVVCSNAELLHSLHKNGCTRISGRVFGPSAVQGYSICRNGTCFKVKVDSAVA
jgi:hypothetical protein